MTLQPFRDAQLNYFKFAYTVLNEFPKALRQTFKYMWDNNFGQLPAFQPWDDSNVVRNLFLSSEGGTTKVHTNLSYHEWDCTALFQATIYARSFALPDSKGHHRTLSDLYVKPLKLPLGTFHASVVSPSGNKAETFALAIDQLRLLRNSLCQSSSSEIEKPTFDQYVQNAKDAFKALGVKTDPIDVIGGLTESDFSTKELEQGINEKTRAYIKFLEGTSSDIDEIRALSTAIKGKVESTASKEDLAKLEQMIKNLKLAPAQDKPADTNPSLPRTCLPPMVQHFTGRQRECDEITSHATSESTRVVSIWGSAGFGKTSVATAVGHRLHSQGLPVYFLSLRGVQSKADLASKLLSVFRRPAKNDQRSLGLSLDDELLQLFSEISDSFVLILDNADEFFGSGVPEVKEDFTHFLEEILGRTEKLTFLITTRESFEFLNVHFQGHQAVRIPPLDEYSSQSLVKEFLTNATPSDCIQITQICGHVPLAMKLLCSSISEDAFMASLVIYGVFNNIVEMLDTPDYPSNLRLKRLFDFSFQKLSAQEREALVSLSVLPGSFDLTVAAAVLGISQFPDVRNILHSLRRKSFLDDSAKPGSFITHKLLESFLRERGEHEMKETILNSKSRLCAFYVSRFEKLNDQFMTGNSMKAFIEFFEDEQSIVQSLIDGCSDPKTANSVFEVLVKAELFLYSLYWTERCNFDKIYNTAIKIAKKLDQNVFYRELLVSRALYEITWVSGGTTMQMLSKAKDIETPHSPVSERNKGKHLCYSGIIQIVTGNTEDGVQCLEEGHYLLINGTPEQRILRIVAFQILAIYYRFKENSSRTSQFLSKALQECKVAGDTELLVISPTESTGNQTDEKERTHQPLKLEILCLVSEATKRLTDAKTKRYISNTVQQIAKDIETSLFQSSLGLLNFQRNVNIILEKVFSKADDAAKMSEATVNFHEMALTECKRGRENYPTREEKNPAASSALHQEALAKSYSDHAYIQYMMQNYSEALQAEQLSIDIKRNLFGEEHSSTADSYHLLGVTQHEQGDLISALRSIQRSLVIRRKLFGEEHSRTADTYHVLGVAQHTQGDFTSAIQSKQRALDIRRKLFGEGHSDTAYSYSELGVTQHAQGDFTSAIQSKQRALHIRLKLFGEEHSSTADSYHSLAVTQQEQGDFPTAIQSTQCALGITLKLFGEEHPSTADSYHLLGVAQHNQGDFISALQSTQRALDIRRKLFGEEHSSTADSYHSLGVTQHKQGDCISAIQSTQRALDMRQKLFGEEHPSTPDSYFSFGVTQHTQGDFTSAIQSKQRALNIRRILFGEEHSSTADSYQSLGITQHEQGDFISAIQSTQRALDIRRELFGEDHSRTADSYRELGVTQHAQDDFTTAIQSKQRALDIRQKLLGDEHPSTADSYRELGVTQHAQGDFISAIQSTQRALDIRRNLFGEEHSNTADSYHSLGITQHALGDFTSAIQSTQRALDIRRKQFGEEHPSTADSYRELGVTQHAQGDFISAIQSKQRVLDIRRKLFGEEHSSTADSYHLLGNTQHEQGDFTSAIQSKQRALDIRRKLFGEEHSSTADSYHLLGMTQHVQGDFTSAIQSTQCALDIRRKLFGEEHSSTADSYHLLGVTQHEQGDFTSAIQSKQCALDIRRKLFGEEHPSTANSYDSLGVTKHAQGDFTSAFQSKQRALDIRSKMFGEEHSSTADSYHSLGATQHAQGDFSSAIQSTQRALDIRRKLFVEEHSSTADSYHLLGVTQHAQGDFTSAIQSTQRALDIRRNLFGEEHSSTADSYHLLGVTQHAQGDFTSAIQSTQRAVDISSKLLGVEHLSTADSYYSLGVTQHAIGDFTSAIQSKQRALDIKRKLFGEEHPSTAASYYSLGFTQYAKGNFTSAVQSLQRALDIRRNLLGEEHSSTANSYYLLGVAQHKQGDFTSAIQSKQRALDIRRKLFGEEHSSTVASYRSLRVTQDAL